MRDLVNAFLELPPVVAILLLSVGILGCMLGGMALIAIMDGKPVGNYISGHLSTLHVPHFYRGFVGFGF